MLKKILLTIVAILIAGGALVIYGTYKATDEIIKEQEPQLRQYVQMSDADKNEYILTHAEELITQAAANAKPDEREDMELVDKTKNDPAVQKALIDLGRALMAKAIMHSDALVNEMSDSVKAKFKAESDDLTGALERYGDVLDAAKAKLKSAQ